MPETVYEPSFNDVGFTFDVGFSEFITLAVGLECVWIGNGVDPVATPYIDEHGVKRYKGGTAGFLYAIYVNGTVQEIGFVSDYEEAKQYLPEGHDSYADWVELLAATPQNALDSEAYSEISQAWAETGTDLPTGSKSSKAWATDSSTYAGQASDSLTTMNDRITALGDFLASAVTRYQSYHSGTTPPPDTPASNWSETATPQKGYYLWSRTVFTWVDNLAPDTVVYTVSYIGMDGNNIQNITTSQIDSLFEEA